MRTDHRAKVVEEREVSEICHHTYRLSKHDLQVHGNIPRFHPVDPSRHEGVLR